MPKSIPEFKNEDEEREFWATHDSADYVDWENAEKNIEKEGNMTKPSCFMIMPITTPESLLDDYGNDPQHFEKVEKYLFVPAIERAGFTPISPKTEGSNLIQAKIIENLEKCDMVLCDMSILNPNVFFELGIRCAKEKPVTFVIDDITKTKKIKERN